MKESIIKRTGGFASTRDLAPMPNTPQTLRPSTYKTLLYTFIMVMSVGLVTTFFFSQSFKKQTVQELAEENAREQAEIVFRTIWHGMLKGWSREEMNNFIHSLELNNSDSKVQLIRGPVVDELFGAHLPSQKRIADDRLIQQVMASGRTYIQDDEGYVRYLYPITAEQNCLQCHTNSAVGKVHGVLDIQFPDRKLRDSLNHTMNFYIFSTITMMLLLFSALFIIVRIRVIHPIRELSKQIREAVQDDLSVIRLDPERYHLREPYTLAHSFNLLADELEDYHEQLRESSYLDSMTGLYNRRYFNEQLPNILKKAKSTEQSCAVLLLDLDRFKIINDDYGHDAGDLALIHFSRVLQQQVRGGDLVIRLGGDEFVIILTHTDLAGVLAVKRNIEMALASQIADLGNTKRFLESSIGYALYPNDAISTEELLRQADQAMYAAKRSKKMRG
ncbi:diguanylate cyclase (GGDEF) domain-containing protein [Oceanospirillum multiglobuliferum]|uniref:Diguanylate cyclase n=1 Tax=Oceanospirillum multiglobuliferum TaxID=64969 RepID=A0A1T4MUK3_9GAMM|nr:diguanylate cyclase [Oceanospirillum multiglobuliferum]OPX56889.1 hypothetical protein BTE48_00180 [Oceanospirillum multiglobuliferum]SJZ70524.1 diguanylate cyclase (GGDEF) domain-containing protein [Oceanospirillum multiglobuliferum]